MITIEEIKNIVNTRTVSGPCDMYTFGQDELMIAISHDKNGNPESAYCIKGNKRKFFVGADARDINAICLSKYIEAKKSGMINPSKHNGR